MVVVVKVGGARAVDPAGVLADVGALVAEGEQVVLVHGGSSAVDDTLERLGETPEYVETPDGVVGRFTDATTMEVFTMVLPGKLNTELVVGLRNEGVDAVGLSGVDGGLLEGPRKSAVRVREGDKRKIRRGDHAGRIERVDAALLETLLEAGRTPVVTVPMLGHETETVTDANGTTRERDRVLAVNTDADRAAAAVAGALEGVLVSLTDVAGIYADPDDPTTRIDRAADRAGFERVEAAAEGFMTRKLMAAREALTAGATRVVIGDANADRPIRGALDGDGTTILPEAVVDP